MDSVETGQSRHRLPALPYDHAALEPYIDARTMTLHHDKHHASYVANLNSALEKYPELRERTAIWLLLNPNKKYENRRAGHLQGWWSVVNWREAARRFEHSGPSPERRWEGDGELALEAAT